MNNETILERVIEEANNKGTSFWVDWKRIDKEWWDSKNYYAIIFSHSFAKAFWGEKETILTFQPDDGDGPIGRFSPTLPAWQLHLQQMVISKDPLQYLKKFLNENT